MNFNLFDSIFIYLLVLESSGKSDFLHIVIVKREFKLFKKTTKFKN